MSDDLKIKKGSLTKYLLAACLSTQVLTAWAQDGEQAAEDGEDPADLGRVVVTGSLIKREDFESVSPMQVITAASCHPEQCNVFLWSNSRGSIKLADTRDRALCDTHAKVLAAFRPFLCCDSTTEAGS